MMRYGNDRIAVGVALFFAYLGHYICMGLANFFKKEKVDKMAFMESKMWIYGSISALSIGLI